MERVVTTPHPFAALVRRLDAEASKAPWEHSIDPVRGPTYEIWAEFDYLIGCHIGTPDAAIIVTLRNAAPEVAALVEAAWQIKAHNYPPDESGHYGELGGIDGDMLFAALDALAAKAKEVS